MSGFGPSRCLLALALVVASGTSRAGERAHTVRSGESAASLAKRYYGDPKLGELLLRHNARAGTTIRPGERLAIPYCDVHEVRMGDSWSDLARLHPGRASAHEILAELNGFAPDEPPRVGETILFPVVLRHSLAPGETLASLSRRFYGDAGKTGLLESFNRIKDRRRLAVGTKLEIPLVSLRLRETGPAGTIPARPPVSSSKVEAPPLVASEPPAPEDPGRQLPETAPGEPVSPEPKRHFEEGIAEAGRLFGGGDYEHAREILETLREPVLSTGTATDRREFGRLLAFVYVAYDLFDAAYDAYLFSSSPPPAETELDPDLVSPRIRSALLRCSAAKPHRSPRLDSPGPSSQISPHVDQER